ncbi:MAG: nucleotidyltransferase family protein [Sphingomonadales bacterium]|nr:nucleotidyltransferase family protein [Sphingomonadales bacterium]
MPAPVEALLLAAGRSARMLGPNKLLLDVAGEPLLRRSARLWLAGGHELLVVTGPDDSAPRAALAGLPVRFCRNARADEGQHTSVMTGIGAARLDRRALAIALADQPLLTDGDIAALVEAFDADGGARIVIPRHDGHRGNPVLLPAAVVRALRDDPAQGPPRRYIDAHPELVRWLDAGHARYTTDLDTPEDAARLGITCESEPR